jgi:acetolactate synthase regulatory subunit
LRGLRSSIISPLRLDSAGLELGLRDRESSPANVLQVLRHHNISIRSMDAEIDEERVRYKLQVGVHPPTDVHAALAELSGLPEVERVSLTGLKDFE